MEKEEILKGIKELGIYEFICNKGYLLTKDQLITILKEVDFQLYKYCRQVDNYTYKQYPKQVKNIIKELEGRL